MNMFNNQLESTRTMASSIQTTIDALNTTLNAVSKQIDGILADNFLTTNEVAELQLNVTMFSKELHTLDEEVEELFLINKTELIRQLNVPIDALIEIVDEIVISSNRNFDEVKSEIDQLEANMTQQYQHVLSRLTDSSVKVPGTRTGSLPFSTLPSAGNGRPPAGPPAPAAPPALPIIDGATRAEVSSFVKSSLVSISIVASLTQLMSMTIAWY